MTPHRRAHDRGRAATVARRAWAHLPLAVLGTLLCHASVEGQVVDLGSLEQLARDGRTDEARRGMALWWEAAGDTASPGELEWALWLRGRLAADPDEAAADYYRLLDEFPSGPYADLALLRLAQTALVRGDSAQARVHYADLVADYQGRPSATAAGVWLELNALAVQAEAALPQALPPEVGEPPVERTVQDQAPAAQEAATAAAALEVVAPQESPAPDPAPREEAPATPAPGLEAPAPEAETPAPEPEPPAPEAQTPAPTDMPRAEPPPAQAVAVQLGAYLTDVRAFRVVERAAEAGFESRVVKVPGSPLFCVRVGTWTERAEAEAVAAAAESAGFRPRIVGGLHREEPINR